MTKSSSFGPSSKTSPFSTRISWRHPRRDQPKAASISKLKLRDQTRVKLRVLDPITFPPNPCMTRKIASIAILISFLHPALITNHFAAWEAIKVANFSNPNKSHIGPKVFNPSRKNNRKTKEIFSIKVPILLSNPKKTRKDNKKYKPGIDSKNYSPPIVLNYHYLSMVVHLGHKCLNNWKSLKWSRNHPNQSQMHQRVANLLRIRR